MLLLLIAFSSFYANPYKTAVSKAGLYVVEFVAGDGTPKATSLSIVKTRFNAVVDTLLLYKVRRSDASLGLGAASSSSEAGGPVFVLYSVAPTIFSLFVGIYKYAHTRSTKVESLLSLKKSSLVI